MTIDLDKAAAEMERLRNDLAERIHAKGYPQGAVQIDMLDGRIRIYLRTSDDRHAPPAFVGILEGDRDSYTFCTGQAFSEAHTKALRAVETMDAVPDYSAWFDMAQLAERA